MWSHLSLHHVVHIFDAINKNKRFDLLENGKERSKEKNARDVNVDVPVIELLCCDEMA